MECLHQELVHVVGITKLMAIGYWFVLSECSGRPAVCVTLGGGGQEEEILPRPPGAVCI